MLLILILKDPMRRKRKRSKHLNYINCFHVILEVIKNF